MKQFHTYMNLTLEQFKKLPIGSKLIFLNGRIDDPKSFNTYYSEYIGRECILVKKLISEEIFELKINGYEKVVGCYYWRCGLIYRDVVCNNKIRNQ